MARQTLRAEEDGISLACSYEYQVSTMTLYLPTWMDLLGSDWVEGRVQLAWAELF